MLNEFVYCPRLFYYEHVEGVFVENADTLRGPAFTNVWIVAMDLWPNPTQAMLANPKSAIRNPQSTRFIRDPSC